MNLNRVYTDERKKSIFIFLYIVFSFYFDNFHIKRQIFSSFPFSIPLFSSIMKEKVLGRMGLIALFTRVYSIGLHGLNAYPVLVEADLSNGLPGFEIVGLPDASVRESKDRVRAALKNSGFTYPMSRITMNLAPADKKKEGSLYDLPLLVALLKASGQLDASTDDCLFAGELSLAGEVRSIYGVLPMVIAAREAGFARVFVPAANATEGAVVDGIDVYGVPDIRALLLHLTNQQPLPIAKPLPPEEQPLCQIPDFSDVRGQDEAKRALEIAASGGHNVLLIGPPGSGKSMLAKRLPSILPDMTFDEMLETTKIHSIAGTLPPGSPLIKNRPFRSPHHTISSAGLAGGGQSPRPGEISLAHNGVLFLDELPEFNRNAMEALRQPMEDAAVTISRANGAITYPCSIMMVAAMNPCPCGYFGHPTRPCTCSPQQVNRYLSRVSGPLLDRMDLHIEVPPVEFDELSSHIPSESSQSIRTRVNRARAIQHQRFKGTGITCNARMGTKELRLYCPMHDKAQLLLHNAFDHMGLSARAFSRVLKVARTIADLDQCEVIQPSHVAEAVQYRSLDRKYWSREL